MSFDGANIQQFPDIPAVSVEILALRGWEGEKGGRRRPRRGFRGRPPSGSFADGSRPVAAERHAQVVNDAVGAVLLIPESKFYIAPNFLCFLLHCFCSTFKLDVISYTKFFDGIEYFQLGKSLVKSLVAYTNKL